MNVSYILKTNGTLSIMIDGKMKSVEPSHINYNTIIEKVNNEDYEGIIELIDVITGIKSIIDETTNAFRVEGNVILYKDIVLNDFMSRRLIDMMKQKMNIKPIGKFLEKLFQNPSYRVVNSLYEFLDYGGIPITSSGNFLVYKKVRTDYLDIHSGKFDNSIGMVVSMPRFQVDEDPTNTCSYGLHVCSFEYLPNYGGSFSRVVICEVNPKDVVAIPVDYNNTKMRVSEYTVIGELDDQTLDELRDKYCVNYEEDEEVEDE